MIPSPPSPWRGPRWALALLLAGLGMLGPFSIDTYLPAFAAIAGDLGATPAQMQQTLSGYLLGFSVMNLFHGALSDSFGRRPVVLVALVLFTLSSIGCALADSVGALVAWRFVQGMCAGSGMVVSRAIIRDLYAPADAQRVMSQVTIFFGIAPAVAPLMGGLLLEPLGWRAIFWMLAVISLALLAANVRLLPESLPAAARRPFAFVPLLKSYGELMSNPRVLALIVASGIPFNGMFLYVLASPVWLGEHLKLAPQQFFWFFILSVGGMMAGAALSGRMAGRTRPRRQVRVGFMIIGMASVLNVLANGLLAPQVLWAFLPVAAYSFGWALLTPVVTLLVLEQAPDRRGTASSIQASVGSLANAVVAGVLVPQVMHSAFALSVASLVLMASGLFAWTWVKRQVT